MRCGLLNPTLLALAVLLAPGALGAQGAKPKPAAPPADQADLKPLIAAQSKARSKALKADKTKPIPEANRVDINGASKEELRKLPGVTDAYADKIIAGRPYLTKIHLVTHDVLPFAVYTAIKGRIIARQKNVK